MAQMAMLNREERVASKREIIADAILQVSKQTDRHKVESLRVLRNLAQRFNSTEARTYGLRPIDLPPEPTRSVDRRFRLWPAEERKAVAAHEAGHAVICEALGTRVRWAGLVSDSKSMRGSCEHDPMTCSSEDRLVVLVGGPVAESHETGVPVSRLLERTDHDDIRRELARMGREVPLQVMLSPVVRRAIQRAETILDRHRAALRGLTDLMARHGQLEGAEIRQVIAGMAKAQQKRNQASSPRRGGHVVRDCDYQIISQ